MDYVQPIGRNTKLETGLKATLRDIESDFEFLNYDQDEMRWVISPTRTDIFFYDQKVYAGYASSTFKLGEKITLITGLRLETTTLDGDFETFQSPFSNTYTNLLPNLTLSKKTGEFNQVRLSYTQRIQRPSQRHINPYVEYNDSRDISFGNPYLSPELVHQLELATNMFIKGNMLSISVYGRRTEDLIENLLRVTQEGISETTYENFGTRTAGGVNVFGSINLGKKLSFRGGFDLNTWEVHGQLENQDLSNSGFDYNGRMNITWTIAETLKAEGFGFFRSPTYTVQGKTPNWSMLSFGIKKELFDKRLSLGINISQPFSENQEFVRELEGDDFYQYTRTLRPVRSFGISAGYRFGKLDFNDRNGRKKEKDSDLKEDDQGGANQFQG
jgi:outer membrane receptor protein involved in Fe transport